MAAPFPFPTVPVGFAPGRFTAPVPRLRPPPRGDTLPPGRAAPDRSTVAFGVAVFLPAAVFLRVTVFSPGAVFADAPGLFLDVLGAAPVSPSRNSVAAAFNSATVRVSTSSRISNCRRPRCWASISVWYSSSERSSWSWCWLERNSNPTRALRSQPSQSNDTPNSRNGTFRSMA